MLIDCQRQLILSRATKFSRSFDHHGKTKEELKNIFSKIENKPERPRSVRKIDGFVIYYASEDACVKFANLKSVI